MTLKRRKRKSSFEGEKARSFYRNGLFLCPCRAVCSMERSPMFHGTSGSIPRCVRPPSVLPCAPSGGVRDGIGQFLLQKRHSGKRKAKENQGGNPSVCAKTRHSKPAKPEPRRWGIAIASLLPVRKYDEISLQTAKSPPAGASRPTLRRISVREQRKPDHPSRTAGLNKNMERKLCYYK